MGIHRLWKNAWQVGVAAATFVLSSAVAHAVTAPVFEVSVDRTQVSKDESVALKFKIRTSSANSVGNPEYQAPDFDEVNQYSSVFVESTYENGVFGVRNHRQITKVLRPTRTGDLVISGIRVQLDGRNYEHPPITIRVEGAGVGTPPPTRYGGTGAGLRAAGKKQGSRIPFIIRAEVDQSKVYKGQQIIVSYYLYRRTTVHNIQVEKYPVLDGFLREDIDLPILGQRLNDRESVVLDGIAYERLLLAKYGAYPLKEGKLYIDSMAIKGNYYTSALNQFDGEDPINQALQNFMQQLQPSLWSHRSEPVPIEVKPLPLDGRPKNFTGGVGDFEVASAVDKPSVKVNEPITLTVKVEGRGNVAAVGLPGIQWPADLEVYETKSKVLPGRAGVSSKVFEVLLIPRKSGRFEIPDIELGFFSPHDKTYSTRKAARIELTVDGGADVAAPAAPVAAGVQASPPTAQQPQISSPISPDGLVLPEQWSHSSFGPSRLSQILIWAMVALSGLGALALVSGSSMKTLKRWFTHAKSRRSPQFSVEQQAWKEIQALANGAGQIPWDSVVRFYQQVAACLGMSVERKLGLPARAWSRAELRHRLSETGGIEEGVWARIENILEDCESVQFSGGGQEQQVRERMGSTLNEARRLASLLQS